MFAPKHPAFKGISKITKIEPNISCKKQECSLTCGMVNLESLSQALQLSEAERLNNQQNACIKLRQVLSPLLLSHFDKLISEKVETETRNKLPLAERNSFGKAFLQTYNLWRSVPAVQPLEFCAGSHRLDLGESIDGIS